MQYRKLGRTGLLASEIGLGTEWLERHTAEECRAVIERCEAHGINIMDLWMSEPNVRTNIGRAIAGRRERWIIQGHISSVWQNDQYALDRGIEQSDRALFDLMARLNTDYLDIGMIHHVDERAEWNRISDGPYRTYIDRLRQQGSIHYVGLSTHNPDVALMAAKSGWVDVIMFSVNPAFDMLPATEDMNDYFVEEYSADLSGIVPERARLYSQCEQLGVGITVMKTYAGGRLFDAARSAFGVALTPVQCLHYVLTRPGICSALIGYDTPEQVDTAVAYETASPAEKDYASVLAHAPRHAYTGQCTYCGHCRPCPKNIDVAMVHKLYDLAAMQPSVPPSVRSHYWALQSTADQCIQCGQCEARCPFQVPIRERMREAARLFT